MRFKINDFEFGAEDSLLVCTGWEVAAADIRSHDTPRGGQDGIFPARDLLGKRTWTLGLATVTSDYDSANALAAAFTNAWEQARRKATPGVLVPLAYQTTPSSQWRCVFGRPRKLQASTADYAAMQGVIKIAVEFDQLDPGFYSSGTGGSQSDGQVIVTAFPATITRGFEFKLPMPFAIRGSKETGQASVVLRVEGDQPSPVRVRFYGPCTSPALRTDSGQLLRVMGRIYSGDYLEIDTLHGTAQNSAGRFVPYMVDPRDRSFRWRLAPGSHVLTVFAVRGSTESVRAEVSWRNVYSTI